MTFNINQYFVEASDTLNMIYRNNRSELVSKYSWAIPTEEVIKQLAKYCDNGIVEICAGNGYWAKCFDSIGIDVVAFDKKLWNNLWFPVKEGDENSVIDYNDRTLFLCWPPYFTSMFSHNDGPVAFNTIKNYKGDTVIYVGEGFGGCTGGDDFHVYLYDNFEIVERLDIPQWWGIHDSVEILKRK